MDARHPYELIPLFTAGVLLGLWLVSSHAFMLAKPDLVQGWLKKFPRNDLAGQIILGVGLAWFWLLVAPEGMGLLSSLRMDLGEFNNIKPILRLLTPIALVLEEEEEKRTTSAKLICGRVSARTGRQD